MDYMDPDVLCPQKRPINVISLSLSLEFDLDLLVPDIAPGPLLLTWINLHG